jgi:hypothetical protein
MRINRSYQTIRDRCLHPADEQSASAETFGMANWSSVDSPDNLKSISLAGCTKTKAEWPAVRIRDLVMVYVEQSPSFNGLRDET